MTAGGSSRGLHWAGTSLALGGFAKVCATKSNFENPERPSGNNLEAGECKFCGFVGEVSMVTSNGPHHARNCKRLACLPEDAGLTMSVRTEVILLVAPASLVTAAPVRQSATTDGLGYVLARVSSLRWHPFSCMRFHPGTADSPKVAVPCLQLEEGGWETCML